MVGQGNDSRAVEHAKTSTSEPMDGDDGLRLILGGAAPHYGFIVDRSVAGLAAIKILKSAPEELGARFNSDAFKYWEASQFEFCVVWGSFGYTGGLTMPAADLETLLDLALPEAMNRTLTKGGLCAFSVSVDASKKEAILGRLAELQPSTGPQH